MKRGKHNFQQHAANMLEGMGIEVPDGGNVLSIYQKELMALGVHPWQVYARTTSEYWRMEDLLRVHDSLCGG
jgi:hypothetical protein